MQPDKLSDREAKDILLREWRGVTQMWPSDDGEGTWFRAQPVAATAGPRLSVPGARAFRTQPDGLWLYFNGDSRDTSVDVVAVEVCGSSQNLNDKRSRYMPSTHSTVVTIPDAWLVEASQRRGGPISKSIITASLPGRLAGGGDVTIPVRSLRVLYALPRNLYQDWFEEHIPSGYEYFMPHHALASFAAPEVQEFLKRMSVWSHFLRT